MHSLISKIQTIPRSDKLIYVFLGISCTSLYLLTLSLPDSDVGRLAQEAANGVYYGEYFFSEIPSIEMTGSAFTEKTRLGYEIGGDQVFAWAIRAFKTLTALVGLHPDPNKPHPIIDGLAISLLYLGFVQMSFMVLFFLLRSAEISRAASFLTTLGAMYGGSFWFYSKPYIRDTFLLLPSTLAFYAIYRLTLSDTGKKRIAWALLAGLSLACGVSFKISFLLAIPCILFFLVSSQNFMRGIRAWNDKFVSGLLIFSLPALSLLWIIQENMQRFGVPLPYQNLLQDRGLLVNGYALTLSPGNGIFVYNPVLILAFPGVYFLWRKKRNVCIGVLSFVGVHFFFYSSLAEGIGWMSYGARLMLPAVMISFIPVSFAIEYIGKKGKSIMIVLSLLGFFIWLPGIILPKNIWLSPAEEVLGREYVLNSFAAGPIKMHWPILYNLLSNSLKKQRPDLLYAVKYKKGKESIVNIGRGGLALFWYHMHKLHPSLVKVTVGFFLLSFLVSSGILFYLYRLIANERPLLPYAAVTPQCGEVTIV